MRPTRVALLDMNKRLRDILSTMIARDGGLILVAAEDAAPVRWAELAPDVLLQEVPPDHGPAEAAATLGVPLGLKILLIETTGDGAALYRIRFHCDPMPGVSIEDLLDAIRGHGPEALH